MTRMGVKYRAWTLILWFMIEMAAARHFVIEGEYLVHTAGPTWDGMNGLALNCTSDATAAVCDINYIPWYIEISTINITMDMDAHGPVPGFERIYFATQYKYGSLWQYAGETLLDHARIIVDSRGGAIPGYFTRDNIFVFVLSIAGIFVVAITCIGCFAGQDEFDISNLDGKGIRDLPPLVHDQPIIIEDASPPDAEPTAPSARPSSPCEDTIEEDKKAGSMEEPVVIEAPTDPARASPVPSDLEGLRRAALAMGVVLEK